MNGGPMTKALLGVLSRVLTSFILLAGATLAPAQPRPAPSCTPLPPGCNAGQCTISSEWIRDNQNCPKSGHDAIVIHKDSNLHIVGGVVFKVDDFKQYKGRIVDGKIQCDWSTRLHTAKPFDDVTTALIGVPAVDLNTYSQVHVLKAKDDCVGCYKVNFPVQGGGGLILTSKRAAVPV